MPSESTTSRIVLAFTRMPRVTYQTCTLTISIPVHWRSVAVNFNTRANSRRTMLSSAHAIQSQSCWKRLPVMPFCSRRWRSKSAIVEHVLLATPWTIVRVTVTPWMFCRPSPRSLTIPLSMQVSGSIIWTKKTMTLATATRPHTRPRTFVASRPMDCTSSVQTVQKEETEFVTLKPTSNSAWPWWTPQLHHSLVTFQPVLWNRKHGPPKCDEISRLIYHESVPIFVLL